MIVGIEEKKIWSFEIELGTRLRFVCCGLHGSGSEKSLIRARFTDSHREGGFCNGQRW